MSLTAASSTWSKTARVWSQPIDAPKHPRSKVWKTKYGPPLYIETWIRGRRRGNNRIIKGFIAYMVVSGPVNPAAAVYRISLGNPTEYTLEQLLEQQDIVNPVLSFYLPNGGGPQPPFYRLQQLDWATYGLELALDAAAMLQGECAALDCRPLVIALRSHDGTHVFLQALKGQMTGKPVVRRSASSSKCWRSYPHHHCSSSSSSDSKLLGVASAAGQQRLCVM
jgi:hypothetical protein